MAALWQLVQLLGPHFSVTLSFRVHVSYCQTSHAHSYVKTVHPRGISRQAMSLHALPFTVFAVQEQLQHKEVCNSGTSNISVFLGCFRSSCILCYALYNLYTTSTYIKITWPGQGVIHGAPQDGSTVAVDEVAASFFCRVVL